MVCILLLFLRCRPSWHTSHQFVALFCAFCASSDLLIFTPHSVCVCVCEWGVSNIYLYLSFGAGGWYKAPGILPVGSCTSKAGRIWVTSLNCHHLGRYYYLLYSWSHRWPWATQLVRFPDSSSSAPPTPCAMHNHLSFLTCVLLETSQEGQNPLWFWRSEFHTITFAHLQSLLNLFVFKPLGIWVLPTTFSAFFLQVLFPKVIAGWVPSLSFLKLRPGKRYLKGPGLPMGSSRASLCPSTELGPQAGIVHAAGREDEGHLVPQVPVESASLSSVGLLSAWFVIWMLSLCPYLPYRCSGRWSRPDSASPWSYPLSCSAAPVLNYGFS